MSIKNQRFNNYTPTNTAFFFKPFFAFVYCISYNFWQFLIMAMGLIFIFFWQKSSVELIMIGSWPVARASARSTRFHTQIRSEVHFRGRSWPWK